MIQLLDNPKTETYFILNIFIKGIEFPWFWHENSTFESSTLTGHSNIPFYSHTFLRRPDISLNKKRFPEVKSQLAETVSSVFQEILDFNSIQYSCFLRMGCNCVHPFKEVLKTSPHVDHQSIEHKNILVYLNDTDGDTVVEGQRTSPEDDRVIVFQGKHYHYTPSTERRIVLVATFI